MEKVADRFRELQENKATTKDGSSLVKDGGSSVEIKAILKDPGVTDLTLDTDESYELYIGRSEDDGDLRVSRVARRGASYLTVSRPTAHCPARLGF